MIKANHTTLYVWLSRIYTRFFLMLAFRNTRYIGTYSNPKNQSILMIANHFSWWDGFIQIRLNLKVFKKRFHFMMLEEQLLKSRILRKVGACSVTKGSRDIIETLKHLIQTINDPNNLYLFFPQGEIQSIYTYPFNFEKGALNYILRKSNRDFQLIFNVNLIDYASFKRPELSVYYKSYLVTATTTADDIEREYNDFANQCLTKQKGE